MNAIHNIDNPSHHSRESRVQLIHKIYDIFHFCAKFNHCDIINALTRHSRAIYSSFLTLPIFIPFTVVLIAAALLNAIYENIIKCKFARSISLLHVRLSTPCPHYESHLS